MWGEVVDRWIDPFTGTKQSDLQEIRNFEYATTVPMLFLGFVNGFSFVFTGSTQLRTTSHSSFFFTLCESHITITLLLRPILSSNRLVTRSMSSTLAHPDVKCFFDKDTNTCTYIVSDPATKVWKFRIVSVTHLQESCRH